MARADIKVTITGVPLFRRLVTFLEEVERHADEECDLKLKEMVEDARQDLLRRYR